MQIDKPKAIVSIDVETDWGGRLPAAPENLLGVRVGLPAIFDILQRYGFPATLFVSGEIVPFITEELTQAIKNNYEIASHGFTHRRMPELSPTEINEELAKSKAILEDATGNSVRGFRAPQARIPSGIYTHLAYNGYVYDSSVFGGRMPTRFKNLDVPYQPYLQEGIWEIPVNQLPIIPFAMGLLWIDLFTVSLVKLAAKISQLPPLVHIYMHPFDVIPSYPVESVSIPFGAKLWYTRRHGSALRTLDNLLSWLQKLGYSFVTAGEMVNLARVC
ncbi:MAG: polysaccharide deacetylase family protein [Moorea sp. SIO2B7]|nr:polysaccharide deacetylase family protein [Moorena sp. SIO2B7]